MGDSQVWVSSFKLARRSKEPFHGLHRRNDADPKFFLPMHHVARGIKNHTEIGMTELLVHLLVFGIERDRGIADPGRLSG